MLRLLHWFVFRRHTTKPPWAMRAEAFYWLAHGDLGLARLFWRGALDSVADAIQAAMVEQRHRDHEVIRRGLHGRVLADFMDWLHWNCCGPCCVRPRRRVRL